MSARNTMCILFRDEAVDAVFVERSMLGVRVRFMERLPRDEQVFDAMYELMSGAEKTPSRVVLCVPPNMLIHRTLRYPAAAKEELDNLIRFEAARHVPLPEADRLLGWSAADDPDGQQVVLNLIAAKRSAVQELIREFEEAGVPVDEAVSLSALLEPVYADRPTMLVFADEGHVELCLYGQGVLQESRSLPHAGGAVTAARQMAAKHKSWLGDEGICRMTVCGDTPQAGSLKEDLATSFGLHVHDPVLPDELAHGLPEGKEVLHEAVLAASVSAPPTLNLIEDQKRKVPISRRTLVIAGLSLLLGFEALAAYAFKTGSPWLQRRKVAVEIEEMRDVTADVQEMRSKNKVFRKQLYQLEKVSHSRTGTMELLKEISDMLPEDTYLQQLQKSDGQLMLKGKSKEPDRLPQLILSLPFVASLSESDIGRKDGDYYEFKLNVSLR